MYLDDDDLLPTWCGTGLEDYVGTAWGMGAHQTPYQGVPARARTVTAAPRPMPDLVSFYRWHLPDPIVFERRLRVTIQQLGAVMVPTGERRPEGRRRRAPASSPAAGGGAIGPRRHRVVRGVRTGRRLLRDGIRGLPRRAAGTAGRRRRRGGRHAGDCAYEEPALMETMLGGLGRAAASTGQPGVSSVTPPSRTAAPGRPGGRRDRGGRRDDDLARRQVRQQRRRPVIVEFGQARRRAPAPVPIPSVRSPADARPDASASASDRCSPCDAWVRLGQAADRTASVRRDAARPSTHRGGCRWPAPRASAAARPRPAPRRFVDASRSARRSPASCS